MLRQRHQQNTIKNLKLTENVLTAEIEFHRMTALCVNSILATALNIDVDTYRANDVIKAAQAAANSLRAKTQELVRATDQLTEITRDLVCLQQSLE